MSVKAFERSVSRVYNRQDQPLNCTHYEFMGLCKHDFYEALTSITVVDGSTRQTGSRYARDFNRTKKKVNRAFTVDDILRKFTIASASIFGTTSATKIAKELIS